MDIEGNVPSYDEGEDPDILTIDMSDLNNLADNIAQLTKEDIAIVPDSPDGGATELGPTGTEELFSRIDNSINTVSGMRATLGAFQSRLDSTISNIDVSGELQLRGAVSWMLIMLQKPQDSPERKFSRRRVCQYSRMLTRFRTWW